MLTPKYVSAFNTANNTAYFEAFQRKSKKGKVHLVRKKKKRYIHPVLGAVGAGLILGGVPILTLAALNRSASKKRWDDLHKAGKKIKDSYDDLLDEQKLYREIDEIIGKKATSPTGNRIRNVTSQSTIY